MHLRIILKQTHMGQYVMNQIKEPTLSFYLAKLSNGCYQLVSQYDKKMATVQSSVLNEQPNKPTEWKVCRKNEWRKQLLHVQGRDTLICYFGGKKMLYRDEMNRVEVGIINLQYCGWKLRQEDSVNLGRY